MDNSLERIRENTMIERPLFLHGVVLKQNIDKILDEFA